MDQNDISHHLQEIHNVRNKNFTQIPVIGDKSDKRMIVTTAGPSETKNLTQEKKSKEKGNTRDPNLRELPNRVKDLVEEKSEEYVVKGDGPCLLRTAAAHMEGNEENGPSLARDRNTHLSEYRPYYKEK